MATNRKPEAAPPQALGATAVKPVERGGWDRTRRFFYDPDTGAVMTRTGKSWLLITIFYIVFYCCLAAFWFGLLQVNGFLTLFFYEVPLRCF
jgi:hypothetical protein